MPNKLTMRIIFRSLSRTTLACFMIFIGSTSLKVMAQSNTQTSTERKIADLQEQIEQLDAILKIRQQEKTRSETIRDIGSSQRNILDASLPQECEVEKDQEGKFVLKDPNCIGLTPASRPYTTDELQITDEQLNLLQAESRILIYEGVKQIAERIKEKVPKGSTVLIYDDDLNNSLIAVHEYEMLLGLLKEDYRQIIDRHQEKGKDSEGREFGIPAVLIPEVATKVTRSAIEFLALFRTDVKFAPVIDVKEELNQTILVSAFASEIKTKKKVNVFFPSLYSPDINLNVSSFQDNSPFSRIQQKISEIEQLKEEAANLITNNEQLNFLNEQANLLISFEKLPELRLGFKAMEILQEQNTYILRMNQVLALGNNQTRTNLFSGVKIRHAGNVMLNYMLFDSEGRTVASDTLYNHSGFQKFKGPRHNLD